MLEVATACFALQNQFNVAKTCLRVEQPARELDARDENTAIGLHP